MVDTSLVFNIVARTADAERGFDRVSRRAKIVGAAMGGAAVLAAKGLYEMAKSAAEDEKSQTQLARALHNSAGATKTQVAATEAWIAKTAQATGVTDDHLRPALQKLVGATHDTKKAQDLLSKALDISAATGKPVEMVSQALTKAYNGQVAGLSRLGIKTQDSVKDQAALEHANIAVTEAQKKYTDAVKEHGLHSAAAQLAGSKLEYAQTRLGEAMGKSKKTTIDFDEAMQRITTQFGGAAQTAANTYQGRLARLHNAFDETKEAVGYRLLPVLTNLAGWILGTGVPALAAFGHWFDQNRKILLPLVGVVGAFAAAVYTINTAARIYTATQAALNFVLSANPIGLVIVGIAALAAGIIYAYKHSQTFREIVSGAFNAVKIAGSLMVDGIKGYLRILSDVWLGVVGVIVDGAAKAFGWVPGIGGKLKDAADKFHDFKDHINAALGGINDKTVKVSYEAVAIGFGRYAGKHIPVPKVATGGAISGPGTGTSDSIPALLSNGEHVITAREVQAAGGHSSIAAWRKGLLRRASGGAVDVDFRERSSGWGALESAIAAKGQALGQALGGPLRHGLDWAATQVGKPYVWGGVGPGGYDCSGFMSAIANVIQGKSPYSRRFATGSMVGGGTGGFSPGSGGFSIGVFQGNPGHTAGTIMGVNVESRGGEGVVVGSRARGANNSLFSSLYHLNGYASGGPVKVGDPAFDALDPRGKHYKDMNLLSFDQGGMLPPGLTLAHNGTGKPEPVGAGNTVVNIYMPAGSDGTDVVKRIQEYERRNGTGWRT